MCVMLEWYAGVIKVGVVQLGVAKLPGTQHVLTIYLSKVLNKQIDYKEHDEDRKFNVSSFVFSQRAVTFHMFYNMVILLINSSCFFRTFSSTKMNASVVTL